MQAGVKFLSLNPILWHSSDLKLTLKEPLFLQLMIETPLKYDFCYYSSFCDLRMHEASTHSQSAGDTPTGLPTFNKPGHQRKLRLLFSAQRAGIGG